MASGIKYPQLLPDGLRSHRILGLDYSDKHRVVGTDWRGQNPLSNDSPMTSINCGPTQAVSFISIDLFVVLIKFL